MKLLHETDRATVVRGDALTVLRELPTGYVDAVIVDPPYSSGGQFRGDRAADPLLKYTQTDSGNRELSTFAGDNRDQRGYLMWCALWLAEALRVARPGAALCMFTDWRQLPTTTDAVQAGGWIWRGIVPWHKPMNRPQQGRFSAACEFVVWGTAGYRSPDYPADTLQGFVSASAPRDRDHTTEKPLTVARHLVRIAPAGGLVLDLFAGAGTVPAAALLEGRRAFAVEVTDHFAQFTADRLRSIELSTPAGTTEPDLWTAEQPA